MHEQHEEYHSTWSVFRMSWAQTSFVNVTGLKKILLMARLGGTPFVLLQFCFAQPPFFFSNYLIPSIMWVWIALPLHVEVSRQGRRVGAEVNKK